MTVTPCTFLWVSVLLGASLFISFTVFRRPIEKILKKFFTKLRTFEIRIPAIPRYGWYGLKYALPVVLAILFFSHLHFVDCQKHEPITKIEDCHCNDLALLLPKK